MELTDALYIYFFNETQDIITVRSWSLLRQKTHILNRKKYIDYLMGLSRKLLPILHINKFNNQAFKKLLQLLLFTNFRITLCYLFTWILRLNYQQTGPKIIKWKWQAVCKPKHLPGWEWKKSQTNQSGSTFPWMEIKLHSEDLMFPNWSLTTFEADLACLCWGFIQTWGNRNRVIIIDCN